MKELKLTEQETTQLYIILMHFANDYKMDTTVFKENGQARTLAKKINEFLATAIKLTLTK